MSFPRKCASDQETDRKNRGDQEARVPIEDGAGIGATEPKYHGERHCLEDFGDLLVAEENHGL